MVLSLSVALLASAPALAQDDGSVAPPIVNGDTTSDFEQVGVLLTCDSSYCSSFCSGTLIAENWVLTAAHCVEAADEYERYGYQTFFGVGRNASNISDYDVAVDLIEHPDYNASSLQHDIGLIELQNGISSVGTMPVNRDTVNSAWRGEELTYVGYGITGDYENDGGTKRTADMPIYDYDSQFIYSLDTEDSQNLCSGDSGGAALENDGGTLELAGVNSFVFAYEYSNRSCEGGGAGVTRVDAHMDFIEDYVDLDESTGSGSDDGSDDGGSGSGSGSDGSGSGDDSGDSGGDDGGGESGGGVGGGGIGWGDGDGSADDDDDDDDNLVGTGGCSVGAVSTPATVSLVLLAMGMVGRRRRD